MDNKTQENLCYIDFDKLFENYADRYYAEHEAEYDGPDDFAKDLDKIYHEWAESPQDVLGGISPEAFFGAVPNAELLEILKGACVGDREPSSLLFDRIAAEPDLADGLMALAFESNDEKLLIVVLSLISEMGGAPAEFYMTMLDRDIDEHVKNLCVDALCDRADEVKDELIERAENATELKDREVYAELLSHCETGDRRITDILKRLLAEDDNIAFVAELMGNYGDTRAASYLYPLLDTCDYATFIELRNAIEQLGGTVDEHYRDFTDDPYYKLIKGKKQ